MGRRFLNPHGKYGKFVSEPLSKRFAKQIEKRGPDECWPWKGGRNGEGYGRIYFDGNTHNAQRAAWILFRGPIPEGMFVCHSCDNPYCVNPAHLFLGTPTDNMRDRDAKGRQARGERDGNAKLTEDNVRAIRRSCKSIYALSDLFGVAPTTIACARNGTTWAHVRCRGERI